MGSMCAVINVRLLSDRHPNLQAVKLKNKYWTTEKKIFLMKNKNTANVKLKNLRRRPIDGKTFGKQKREDVRNFGKPVMKNGRLLKKRRDREEYLQGR